MAETIKPYVRYSITTPLTDKGVGYTLKRAVTTFLKTHGFSGRVTELNASSDNFSAVLELFDNGNYDFNLEALQKHIEVSGRLPSQESLRPTDIRFKPLSCDSALVVSQESPDSLSYQRAFDKFLNELKEKDEHLRQKESTIGRLNSVLQERQATIDETTKKIDSLEQRVSEARPKQYSTARDAVFNGYLKNAVDTYLGLSVDIMDLTSSNNLDSFPKFVSHDIPFSTYFNNLHRTEFRNDRELEDWRKKMEGLSSWGDSEDAKSMEELKKQYSADEEILTIAEQKGASPDILDLLKAKVIEGKVKRGKLDAEITAKQVRFNRDKQIYDLFAETRERYNSFKLVGANSSERKREGVTLPIVLESLPDKAAFTLLMPYNDGKCALESLFYQKIESAAKKVGCPLEIKRIEGEGHTLLKSVLDPSTATSLQTLLEKVGDDIKEDRLLRSLGVTTVVTVMSDKKTRPTKN